MSKTNLYITLARLTRDPEFRGFQNGGGVANFDIATTGENKKNQQSGEWEETPCFLDCKAFDGGEGKKRTGNTVMKYLKKGNLVLLKGHLITESWTDKTTGANRSTIRFVVDDLDLLPGQKNEQQSQQQQNQSGSGYEYSGGGFGGDDGGDIPF